MQIPPLSSRLEWESPANGIVKDCQDAILWAKHVVIFYPLWLSAPPATVKAFFEQVLRPDFAFDKSRQGTLSPGRLRGKSARVIVTSGMPDWFYRWYFFSLTLRALKRNILYYVGIGPVRTTVLGSVEGIPAREFERIRDQIVGFARDAR